MSSRRPPILMYHAIARLPDDPTGSSTSPERFQAQMRYLKRRNLREVSVRELLRATSLGQATGLVGLTFDDGYEDFLTAALPVLERFGFSATVFVVGSMPKENNWEHADGPNHPMPRMKLLGAEEVREVAARGMEVGAHSMSHVRLCGLEPELLAEEVGGSRRILAQVLGEAVEGFCYPYGSIDKEAIQAVSRAHYSYACAIRAPGKWNVKHLPRIPLTDEDNSLRFSLKLRVYSQYSQITKILKKHNRSSASGLQGTDHAI